MDVGGLAQFCMELTKTRSYSLEVTHDMAERALCALQVRLLISIILPIALNGLYRPSIHVRSRCVDN